MTRLELQDGQLNRFWEVERDGATLVFTTGQIGWTGRARRKRFPTEAAAREEMGRAIQAMRAQGYLPADTEDADEVWLAVAAHPEDPEAMQVYADHLQATGDDLGEWIALNMALERARNDQRGPLEERVDQFRDEHVDALFGGVPPAEGLDLGWRHGMVSTIRAPRRSGNAAQLLSAEIGRLLGTPVGRLVQRIRIKDLSDANRRLVSDLVAGGRTPSVRVLQINSGSSGSVVTMHPIGVLSGLYQVFPNLLELEVSGGRMVPGGVVLEQLERLVLRTAGLMGQPSSSRAGVRFLSAFEHATVPRLQTLDLSLGLRAEYAQAHTGAQHQAPLLRREEEQVAALERALDPERMPALRHLAIRDHFMRGSLLDALLGHPIVGQLDTLALTVGLLGDEEAGMLMAEADLLRHLEVLDLSDNVFSRDAVRALRRALPQVELADQTDLRHLVREEYRYQGITE